MLIIWLDQCGLFFFQPYQKSAMKFVALVIKALKRRVQDLCKLYVQNKKADQPNFPFIQNVNGTTLSYKMSINPHLYRCSLDAEEVVTKFVEEKYGIGSSSTHGSKRLCTKNCAL